MKTLPILTHCFIALLLCSCAGTNFGNMCFGPNRVQVLGAPHTEKKTGRPYAEVYTYKVDEPWYTVFAGAAGMTRRITLTRDNNAVTAKHYLTPEERKILGKKILPYSLFRSLPSYAKYQPQRQHLTLGCVPCHPLNSRYLLWCQAGNGNKTQFLPTPQTITLHASADRMLNGKQTWDYVDRIGTIALSCTPISAVLLTYEYLRPE